MGQYVVFQLGKEQFGVHIENVSSIEVMQPITHVPGSPEVLRGVINLRGKLTPVIDMHLYFRTGLCEPEQGAKIVVLFDGQENVGLIVDDANNVLKIADEQIEPVSKIFGSVQAMYFEGIANLPEATIGILNIEKVLNISAQVEIDEDEIELAAQ